jgi:hypothetical protein
LGHVPEKEGRVPLSLMEQDGSRIVVEEGITVQAAVREKVLGEPLCLGRIVP